jgi:hypothetical protein
MGRSAVANTRGGGAMITADAAQTFTTACDDVVGSHPLRAGFALAGLIATFVVLASVSTAFAGTYTVVSCPGDDGWAQDTPSALFVPYADGCAGGATAGLTLALGPNPESGYSNTAGGAITFTAPVGMSISSYAMSLSAYGGPCSIASNQCANSFGAVAVNHTGQADPDYDYRNLGYGAQTAQVATGPLPSGVTWVTVTVGCDGGPGGYSCPGSQGSLPEADAVIQQADFAIDSTATPSASGFTGSLLAGSAHGTANIAFTAADSGGPGVYNVTATIDGTSVYDATPNGNAGACQSIGTYSDGSLEFEQLLPCPQQVAVDIPVNTTTLRDGAHELKVTVTDAAGNTSVVYDATVMTANLTTVSSLTPSPATTTAAAVYSLSLDAATKALTSGVRRSYSHSGLKLSGTLEDASGVAAPDVPVALWQQPASGGAFTELAHTTTDGAGGWTLTAPPGSSRLLRVVAGVKARAATATSSVSVRETVTPGLSLRVTTPGGGRIVFTGKLAIAPLGQPRPLVFIQTRGPDGWEEVGSPIRVAANGDFRYVYRSSPVTFGRSFNFRAASPATALWQPAQSRTHSAVVH